jgi:hypothetical protein
MMKLHLEARGFAKEQSAVNAITEVCGQCRFAYIFRPQI